MNMKIRLKTMSAAVVFGVVCVSMFSTAWAENVPRMTIETLKNLMGSPGTMILDVRSGSDWDSATAKIKSAERADPRDIGKWAENYPKGVTLVLY